MSDDGQVQVRLPRLVAVDARRRSAAPRAVRRVPRTARTRLRPGRRVSLRADHERSAAASRAGLLGNNPGSIPVRRRPGCCRRRTGTCGGRSRTTCTWTRGRHNFKFGFYGEWASKTEPQSNNYMGNYNFGHNAQNPLSTGNGYANALLGVFTTYTELTNRVDRDRRHWQTEGYRAGQLAHASAADARLRRAAHPQRRLLRHAQVDGGLLRTDWNRANAPRLYYPVCTTGVPGNQTCAANNQRAVDPANPTVLLPSAFIGNLVPGTGSQINGMVADGYPGHAAGRVLRTTRRSWPRRGSASHGTSTATASRPCGPRRESSMRFPTRGDWENFVGDPPAAFNRVVQWATLQRHRELRDLEHRVRRDPDQRGVLRRRTTVAREVLQRERDLSARHRLQHDGRSGLCRRVHVCGRAH